VTSEAFSSDGHTQATASQDTTVIFWDVSDPPARTALTNLTGHASGAVPAVALETD
jgi:hypothetical protein